MSATIVSAGQSIDVGAVASGDDVIVLSSGTAAVASVAAGGTLDIQGGIAVLGSGAAASGALLEFAYVYAGTPYPAGGTLEIGGTAMPTAIISGYESVGLGYDNAVDLLNVAYDSTGSASLGSGNVLTVREGGHAYVLNFDPSQSFAFEQFQLQSDGSGGTEITLGNEVVSAGSTVSSVTLSGYQQQITVESGGTVSAILVRDDAVVTVFAGGIADAASFTYAGSGQIYGTASGTLLSFGGMADISGGGSAISTTVIDGSTLDIHAGGTATATALGSGGTETVSGGGLDSGASVGSSGLLAVSVGGTAEAPSGASGGTLLVDSGLASGVAIAAGGTLQLAGGTASLAAGSGAAAAVLQFVNGAFGNFGYAQAGTLAIAGTVMPAAVIGGFDSGSLSYADVIDLAGVAFDSAGTATLGSGNVLTVSESGHSYQIAFATAQGFGAESFQLHSDGASGTDIVLGNQTVSAGSSASGIAVNGGAELIVLSGGTADATSLHGGTLVISAGGSAVATLIGAGSETDAGFASLTSVGADGVEAILSGGVASGTTIGSGGSATVVSGGTADASVISTGGLLLVHSGGSASAPSVASGGTLEIAGGTAVLASGDAGSGAALVFGSYGGFYTVTLEPTGGTLEILGSAMPAATIIGFDAGGVSNGDVIDLAGIALDSSGTANLGSGNVLTVSEGGHSYVLAFDPAQLFGGKSFHLQSDGGSGTDLVLGNPVVAAGQTLSGLAIGAGTLLTVLSGGTANATALVGGTLLVSSGGHAIATSITAGTATEFGSASLTLVSGGGVESVTSGGVASSTTVLAGGSQSVASGGVADATLVGSGGELDVGAGGSASFASVGSLGTGFVSSGGTATATAIGAGGDLLVFSGGSAGVAVAGGGVAQVAGGTVVLDASGAPSGAVVEFGSTYRFNSTFRYPSGGTLEITGSAMPAAIISGFDSSGPSWGDVIDLRGLGFASGGSAGLGSGNVLTISVGGHSATLDLDPAQSCNAESVLLASDGSGGTDVSLGNQTVTAGSSVSGLHVAAGTELVVAAGGTADATMISGGVLLVSAGGLALGTVIASDSDITPGKTENATEIFGSASATSVGDFGSDDVESGGVATATSVGGGGTQSVLSGGTADASTVAGGGLLLVASGGIASFPTLASGGTLELSGGTAVVSAADLAAGALLRFGSSYFGYSYPAAGTLDIVGSAMPSAVIGGFGAGGPGGGDVIDLAGIAFDSAGTATLGSGNVLTVSEGGHSYLLTLQSGQSFPAEQFDLQDDGSGGTAIVLGNQIVGAGSSVSGVAVSSGGQLFVASGGTASATSVTGYGTITVESGGRAVATVLTSGYEEDFGSATSVAVGYYGTEEVWSGASVSASQVSGVLRVQSGGTADAAVFGYGGTGFVNSGGVAFAASVGSGGTLYVDAGAVADATTVASYGLFIVGSGGNASGVLVASGGTLEIGGGAATIDAAGLGAGTVAYFDDDEVDTENGTTYPYYVSSYAGTLEITGTAMPSGLISGFDSYNVSDADVIDLAGVAYDSAGSATLGSGNVLTVGEGSSSYVLAFDPAQNLADKVFQLHSDGSGGTDITLINQTIASGVTLPGASVGVGAELDVASGGTASAAVINGGTLLVSAGGLADATTLQAGYQFVHGSASATTASGGLEAVYAGGVTSRTVLDGSGSQFVNSGGVADATSVGNGAAQYVFASGTADATSVGSGGTLIVSSGGLASDLTLASFASLDIAGGAAIVASGSAVPVLFGDRFSYGGSLYYEPAGGTLEVSGVGAIGLVSGFDVQGAGYGDVIDLAGIAFDSSGSATLGSGNLLTVTEGGQNYAIAFDPTQSFALQAFALQSDSAGGTEIVLSNQTVPAGSGLSGLTIGSSKQIDVGAGASASAITVSAGGLLVISAGGLASGILLAGGTDLDFGTTSATSVGSRSYEDIGSGGIASGGTVGAGGTQYVSSGGTAEATSVAASGTLLVVSGGSASVAQVASGGTLTISGGVAVLESGAAGSGAVVQFGSAYGDYRYTPGGTLGIAGTVMPTAVLGGFDAGGVPQGDVIDLQGVGFASSGSATLGSGNVLTVSVGGQHYALALDPAQGFGADLFVLSSDGAGGTDIGLANQSVAAGTTADAVSVSFGAELLVPSGASASATVVNGGTLLVASGGSAVGSLIVGGSEADSANSTGAGMEDDYGSASATSVGKGGVQTVFAGGTADASTVASGGLLVAGSGGHASGARIASGGTLEIAGGTASIAGGAAGSGAMLAFASLAPGGTLVIAGSAMPSASILGFDAGGGADGDVFDLASIPFAGSASASATLGFDNVLTVSDGGHTVALTLDPTQNFKGERFHVGSDGAGGSEITLTGTAPCFAAGTRILTADGDVAVEDLRVGDLLRTASGALAPVRWIGRRRVACALHPRPAQVRPVRVTAGAFGPGLPRRDLLLSPDHAVFCAGVLIPVRHLVNGTSIAPLAVAVVTYFHIELPRHDVLLADGLPCESFLDTGNRGAFENGGATMHLHPDFSRRLWDAEACAPLCVGGAPLDAARALVASAVRDSAALPATGTFRIAAAQRALAAGKHVRCE